MFFKGTPEPNQESLQTDTGCRLPFPLECQQASQWCWLAITASVATYYGPSSHRQCQLATVLLGCNPDCCARVTICCDKRGNVALALGHVGHQGIAAGRGANPAADFSAVVAQLRAGHPVCCVFAAGPYTTHTCAMTGWAISSNARWVYVHDPQYGTGFVRFDDLWSRTVGYVTTVGQGKPCSSKTTLRPGPWAAAPSSPVDVAGQLLETIPAEEALLHDRGIPIHALDRTDFESGGALRTSLSGVRAADGWRYVVKLSSGAFALVDTGGDSEGTAVLKRIVTGWHAIRFMRAIDRARQTGVPVHKLVVIEAPPFRAALLLRTDDGKVIPYINDQCDENAVLKVVNRSVFEHWLFVDAMRTTADAAQKSGEAPAFAALPPL